MGWCGWYLSPRTFSSTDRSAEKEPPSPPTRWPAVTQGLTGNCCVDHSSRHWAHLSPQPRSVGTTAPHISQSQIDSHIVVCSWQKLFGQLFERDMAGFDFPGLNNPASPIGCVCLSDVEPRFTASSHSWKEGEWHEAPGSYTAKCRFSVTRAPPPSLLI